MLTLGRTSVLRLVFESCLVSSSCRLSSCSKSSWSASVNLSSVDCSFSSLSGAGSPSRRSICSRRRRDHGERPQHPGRHAAAAARRGTKTGKRSCMVAVSGPVFEWQVLRFAASKIHTLGRNVTCHARKYSLIILSTVAMSQSR